MINALVKYIRVDTEDDKATGYYPPVGTYGIVEDVADSAIHVRWDEGTKNDQLWWCDIKDVEAIYNPKIDGRIVAARLHCPRPWYVEAELVFNQITVSVPWERVMPYIDPHTLIYDERNDITFDIIKAQTKYSMQ